MARKLRIEYGSATYHVMARGGRRHRDSRNRPSPPRPDRGGASRRSGAEWCDERDGVACVLAKKPEVAVRSADLEIVMHFRESHHAAISEIHRRVGVKAKEFCNGLQFVAQRYRFQADLIYEFDNASAGYPFLCSQMANLCEHRFANQRSRSQLEESSTRPIVALISRSEA